MTDADIELNIYRILSGVLYFYFKDEKYELRYPDNNLRYNANLLYQNIINSEKYMDWIREENIVSVMIYLGLWTKDSMKIIKSLEKKVEDKKVSLYKSALFPDRQKKCQKDLDTTRDELNGLLMKKYNFFNNTLEGYAISLKNEHIVCNTLYKNNKLVLSGDIENNQTSYMYFNDLLNKINKNIINMVDFKHIARSTLWRSFWNANKENIFPSSSTQWTDDQRTLVNVTKMYDSIYEHPDCPSTKVIEYDDMLDGWMIFQQRKIETMKKKQSLDDLNPNLKNASEVFLMSHDSESYEEIMSLNDDSGRNRIKEKLSHVTQYGSTKESNLPDVQRDLMSQSIDMVKNRK